MIEVPNEKGNYDITNKGRVGALSFDMERPATPFFSWPAHQSVWMDVTAQKPSLMTGAAKFLTPSCHNINLMLAPLVYGVW